MKDIKIIIGANYGDEGKGLVTHHFSIKDSIIILDNGTAQRGHTVDYKDGYRHIYHHFGSGLRKGARTYYGPEFLIHPMEYVREYTELYNDKIQVPDGYFDPLCKIITPYDMLIDHMTEDFIAIENGEREYGSCGYGSWCATHRFKHYPESIIYMSDTLKNREIFEEAMVSAWRGCLNILNRRGVELDKLTKYEKHLNYNSDFNKNIREHFYNDIIFFLTHNKVVDFNTLWKHTDNFIFEMGQGLGLDHSIGIWHTTSNTGLQNPYSLLKDKDNYNAEVCYVTRSYLTRHGVGPLEENVHKNEINSTMHDATNVHNEFQGSLRYGYLEKLEQEIRINNDWNRINNDKHFTKSMVITHCNEFDSGFDNSKYYSDDKYSIKMRN